MSRKSLVVLSGIVGGLTLCCGAALAHHSDAMFDHDSTLELTGTVKQFQFTNPHTWLQVVVKDESGKEVEWSLEWGSPNQLGRQGIRPSTFVVGAEVVVHANPMRDGSPGGAFVGAKFADGKTVGRWN
ncbi:MAG: hypothetical protein LBF16_13750 [Pseudomonadales bacterium]|jgi:hypothetical protein|nr:hypothetical protein [Pseudomonadales bacterium]